MPSAVLLLCRLHHASMRRDRSIGSTTSALIVFGSSGLGLGLLRLCNTSTGFQSGDDTLR